MCSFVIAKYVFNVILRMRIGRSFTKGNYMQHYECNVLGDTSISHKNVPSTRTVLKRLQFR